MVEVDGEGINFGTRFGYSESTRVGNCAPTASPSEIPTSLPSSSPSMQPTSTFQPTTEATTIFGDPALPNQFIVGGSPANPIPIPQSGTSGSTSITFTITGDAYGCPIDDMDVLIRLEQ